MESNISFRKNNQEVAWACSLGWDVAKVVHIYIKPGQ